MTNAEVAHCYHLVPCFAEMLLTVTCVSLCVLLTSKLMRANAEHSKYCQLTVIYLLRVGCILAKKRQMFVQGLCFTSSFAVRLFSQTFLEIRRITVLFCQPRRFCFDQPILVKVTVQLWRAVI